MPLTVKQRMINELIEAMESDRSSVTQKIAIAKLLAKVNPKIPKPNNAKHLAKQDIDNT